MLYPAEVVAVNGMAFPVQFETLPDGLMLAVAVETATVVAVDVSGRLQSVPVTV